ncbi:O-acetylhomoserine aminocarboxypropyltransferase [Roseospirillum parvum]|uniref:O-acetylhomoserine (Thiol)-lyase n=1 Tax=Roseospirillum parvum TaxID=83401 RepID=A0A1G7V614_9PROT|nr:O-acetylhomoserine aminocarboxypropyltransferase [Roseospirillum parvum]SDG55206.1 O-acetylhomoserine (thiol)-lyase [Roseospirillum parvum]
MTESTHAFATQAVHAGTPADPATGARVTPIYQNTSYVFEDSAHAAALFNLEKVGYIYSRLTNPTVMALQQRLAALEGGAGATCTASGHAAQLMTLFALMGPGDNVVASNRLYGGSLNQFSNAIRKFGWEARFVDATDPAKVAEAIDAKTKAVFVEVLANPGGIVLDLAALAEAAHDNPTGPVPLIVDNTLATPYLLRPFEHGADIVVHSTTKFLSGQGTALGGVAVDSGKFDFAAQPDRFPSLARPVPDYHGMVFTETFGPAALTMFNHAIGLRDLGAAQSPMNAFLTLSGIETLPLRMARHSDNALAVAQWLKRHAAVSWVSYAGLADSPYHALARRYLPRGAGAVFTFGLKGGYEAGVKVVEGVKLISHLANIGDTRSLIIHPASTTHRQLPEEGQIAAGAGPDVVRLSVGIEAVEDIVADLDQAIANAG